MNRFGCPVEYWYGPAVFDRPPDLSAHTLYVVGGLYGNVFALRAILELRQREERERHSRVDICFNGDFNWLNVDEADFTEINESVLAEHAIRGNVETELVGTSGGCGCNYPAYVGDDKISLSNSLFERLHGTVVAQTNLIQALSKLPMTMTVVLAEQRVGILHGDPESLAGWGFAVERMPPEDVGLRRRMGSTGAELTSIHRIEAYFKAARVNVFASSHTGLPFMQDFTVNDAQRLVVNNGAAGMPNFRNTPYGLITRISADPEPPPTTLYGSCIGNLRCDALPVEYDYAQWQRHFLRAWPPGSPGHTLYRDRIENGPDFYLHEARRGKLSAER